jgi:hypothetical protein
LRQEVKNKNGSVANQAPLSTRDRWQTELPPIPLKLAIGIYKAIEANSGQEVRLSARELAERTGLSQRIIEDTRKLLADQGVIRMSMKSRRWWYSLSDEIRQAEEQDRTPTPTEEAGPAPVPELAPACHAETPVPAAEGHQSGPACGAEAPAAEADTETPAAVSNSLTTPAPACGAGSQFLAPAARSNETSSTGAGPSIPTETAAETPAPESGPTEPAPPATAQAGPPSAPVEPPAAPPPTLQERLGAAMQKRVPSHKITLADIRRAQERVPDSEIAFAFMEHRAKQGRMGTYTNIEVFLADLWNQCTAGSNEHDPSAFRLDWDRCHKAPRP